jgi:hypothetical protein
MRSSALLLVAACSAASTACSVPNAPAAAPQRATLTHAEVALGYELYRDELAYDGSWQPDSTHGARWCPSAEAGGAPAFEPYVSRGRWVLSTERVADAPAGTAYWQSEDADTWGEITTHHGWWIRTGGRSGWCWVPGASATPASVVWTTEGDVVGWAPALPPWDAPDSTDDDRYDWSFALLGTLCDGFPDQDRLTGHALREARARAAGSDAKARPQRVGPSAAQILAARNATAAYSSAHPSSALAAAFTSAGSNASAARHHASRSGRSSSSGGHSGAHGGSGSGGAHRGSSHHGGTKKHHR